MKHIVVDLEMNPIAKQYKKERAICLNEIIEIGAVILDEDFQEIGSFMTYVKPEYNERIEPNIVRLTGITKELVSNAPLFEEAFEMFISFCSSIKDEVEICQWSDSDRHQIEKEMCLKGYEMDTYEEKLMKCWVDFQKEFDQQLGLNRQVSLKDALTYAGLEFEGRRHDALVDARNTAELLTIARVEEKRQIALDKIAEMLNPTPLTSTLGSMFDFENFTFA